VLELFIGKKAFYNCSCLWNVDICDGVTSIRDSAFENCNLGSDSSKYPSTIYIPNSVWSFGNNIFDGCGNIEICVTDRQGKKNYLDIYEFNRLYAPNHGEKESKKRWKFF